MKVENIMEYIRNVVFVIINKGEGYLSCYADELETTELELEFEWFEVKQFKGKPCIEFNNCK